MRRSSNRRGGHSTALQHQPSRQSSSSLGSAATETAPPPPPPTEGSNRFPHMGVSSAKGTTGPPTTDMSADGGGGGGGATTTTATPTTPSGMKNEPELLSRAEGGAGPSSASELGPSGDDPSRRGATSGSHFNENSPHPSSGFPPPQQRTRAAHKASSGESAGFYSNRHPGDRSVGGGGGGAPRRGGGSGSSFSNQPSMGEDWNMRQQQRASGMSWRRSIPDRQNLAEAQTNRSSYLQGSGTTTDARLGSPAHSEFREPPSERHYRGGSRHNVSEQGWQPGRRRHSGGSGAGAPPPHVIGHRPPSGTPNTTPATAEATTTAGMTPTGGTVPSPHWNKEPPSATSRFDYQQIQQWLQSRAAAVISEYRAQQNRRRGGLSSPDAAKTPIIRLVEVTQRPAVQPPREDFLQQLQQALADAAAASAGTSEAWQFQQKRALIYQGQQQPIMAAAPAYSIVTDGLLYYQAPTHPALGVDLGMFGFQQQAALQQQMMVLMPNSGGIPMMPASGSAPAPAPSAPPTGMPLRDPAAEEPTSPET